MTVKELRERLKHIAGLCYGLSSDLSILQEEFDIIQNDNEGLVALLKAKDKELKRMRDNIRIREWYRKKVEENPEEMKKRARENNKKAKERKEKCKNKK